ncbi:ubiquinol oxidase subunit II [Paenibacillus lutrae]|uniref:Quinol oxidase subunit 2 n=1 Tax=Paenibacillus lutrae TaxID=2078573 RepID=A0A7X3FIR4_9BACL|nr:ubiquinol oxidase subunit II [Paenibacillus lutrae]
MKKAKLFRRFTASAMLVLMAVLSAGCDLIVLDPKGPIGQQQLDLIIISTILCLVIIAPVLIITFVIVWRYRDKPGRKAKYEPNWEHSTKLETIWWGIPIIIILALAVVTVKYTYALEPSKPIEAEAKPITIQVTSLDWKWLFKYPEQGIATVNYVQFPEDVPVRFELTADSPMNSFWIPQLGGQVYTMSGMAMKLHLMADEPGEYMGSGANFTGRDFGSMRFVAKATSQQEFDEWVKKTKAESPALTMDGYKALAVQGVSEVKSYSSFPNGLFEQIVTKYGAHNNHGATGENSKPAEGAADKSSTDGNTSSDGAAKKDEHSGHSGH